ncbi:MAG: hypothetical protein ABN485_21495 [Pantoea agglomerans]
MSQAPVSGAFLKALSPEVLFPQQIPHIFEFDLLTLPAVAIFFLLVSETERPLSPVISSIIPVVTEE